MYQSHGIGFAEYGRSLEKRMKVEREREKSYHQGLEIMKERDRKVNP